jgi:large subunit ribosomal protein L25
MTYAIAAQTREKMGRQAKQERANMRIPAVMYGAGTNPTPVSVNRSEFLKMFRAAGYSSLVDLALDGKAPTKVVVKDVQVHPLTLEPQHVDFHQIRMDKEMTANIPLVFIGESKAVKQDGGTLVKSMDELEITCLPANLPHEIQVDLSTLNTFEDSITIENLKLPEGVKATAEGTLTIATVARPLTEEELKKLEETTAGDVTQIKTEGEEKKAAEEAKKAEEAAAEAASK